MRDDEPRMEKKEERGVPVVETARKVAQIPQRDREAFMPQGLAFDKSMLANPARLLGGDDPEAMASFFGDQSNARIIGRMKLRLKEGIALLEKTDNHSAALQLSREKFEELSELRVKNLGMIYQKLRPIEQKIRQLDILFQNASTSPNDRCKIWIFNAKPEDVFDPSKPIHKEFWKRIEDMNKNAFYKGMSYSYVLVPGNYTDPRILNSLDAKLKENRMLLVTDIFYADGQIRSFPDAEAQLTDAKYQGLIKETKDRAHVVSCFNEVLVRAPWDEFEKKGIFVPASVFVTGAMYKTDLTEGLQASPAGDKLGNIVGGYSTKMDVNLTEADLCNLKYQLVPIVAPYGRGGVLQIYGVRNLSSQIPYRQIAVIKVSNYISKMLHNIAEKVKFQPNNDRTLEMLRAKIEKFLRGLPGYMINKVQNIKVEWDSSDKTIAKISADIEYMQAVEKFEYYLPATTLQDAKT